MGLKISELNGTSINNSKVKSLAKGKAVTIYSIIKIYPIESGMQ